MLPIRHDMTRDECRKCLRCMELDAYGSMVSVLRAQGPFNTEKQTLLQELAKVLHISNERHRAEVRRAVNDERLALIAEQLNGPNTGTDWTIEGRRIIPLLPRLKARNALTTLANSLSLATEAANERKPIICEKLANENGTEAEAQMQLMFEENVSTNMGIFSKEDKLNDRKRSLEEVIDCEKDLKISSIKDNHMTVEQFVTVEGKSSLPMPPPNKVLVVSSNTVDTSKHDAVKEILPRNNINAPQKRSVAPLSVGTGCATPESTESYKNVISQLTVSCGSPLETSKHISTLVPISVSNGTKTRTRIMTMQNKLTPKKIPSTLLLTSVSGDSIQPEIQNTQTLESTNATISPAAYNSLKTLRSESVNSNTTCIKRVTSIVHSNTKPSIVNNPVISNSTHRVMTVCPGTTVSSGPGPPSSRQATTTLMCKKLQPTLHNHQSTAKMGVTLNSSKTVNISRRPSSKLPSKTNVIVIQKGHNKGVTLSHAGKEVLGKVIMGGKKLCVTSQQNANSVSMLQQHIAISNGDMGVTAMLPTNSPHIDTVKANPKTGSPIVFNLRQDILEKNKILSQLLESSNVVSSESKTVIESTRSHLLNEENESDYQSLDVETAFQTNIVIPSEKKYRNNKGVSVNAKSEQLDPLDASKAKDNEEVFVNSSQLASMQDDNVNSIQIEESICNMDVNMLETDLGSADINSQNFEYLVESGESCIIEEASPIFLITHTDDFDNS